MSNKLNVPGANELAGTMTDGIELPFPATFFYPINGKSAYKGAGGAPYFGGWSVDKETADAVIVPFPADALPPAEFDNREGQSYSVYTTRTLYAAAIAKRKRWNEEPGMKPRSHVQVLAMLAVAGKVGGKTSLIPIGVHVLTAKGWQAANLENAFNSWTKITAGVRREVAGNAPANFFYAGIGTFGETPNVKQVGTASTSPITPIGLEPLTEVSEERLIARYVGDDVARDMTRIKTEAAEWLAAWDEKKQEAASTDFGGGLDMDITEVSADGFGYDDI